MIEPSDFFSAKEHNIKSILKDGNKFFYVPHYQRNFAWTKDELEKFWDDFKNTYSNAYDENYGQKLNVKPHFFGTILLTESESGKYEITDGQQRLTVSTIFLKTLLEVSHRLTDHMKQTGIKSLILPLIQKNDYDEPFKQRIELDDTINDFYKDYILLKNNKDERENYLLLNPIRSQNPPSSKQRLKEALDFFISKLDEDFPTSLSEDELHNKLLSYISTFIRLFTVLEIIVKDKETAYTIFGTLNNRGKDLTDSDIIKNEIFKSVDPSKRGRIKENWDLIIENIDTEDLTDYLRFQYASTYGPVKKVDLFKVITKLLSDGDPLDYLEQLKVESEWFARVNLIETFWDDNITKKLEAFKVLDISHSLPLLLAAAVKYNANYTEFEKLVNATLVFCFRYFTIGRNSVENLEREIGQLSKDLRNNSKTPAEIITYMNTITSDQEFVSDFEKFVTKSAGLAFYILYELEKSRMTGVIPLPHSPSQHVEHIMPKKPSRAASRQNEWGHVRNNPEYKDYVYRLGNMIILESEKNQKVGNKEFDEKKQVYKTSGLSYPKEIALAYSTWDFDCINQRQQKMATEALKVWKYY